MSWVLGTLLNVWNMFRPRVKGEDNQELQYFISLSEFTSPDSWSYLNTQIYQHMPGLKCVFKWGILWAAYSVSSKTTTLVIQGFGSMSHGIHAHRPCQCQLVMSSPFPSSRSSIYTVTAKYILGFLLSFGINQIYLTLQTLDVISKYRWCNRVIFQGAIQTVHFLLSARQGASLWPRQL